MLIAARDRAEMEAELDGIIAELRDGYPDLVGMEPDESIPASIAARVSRIRDMIAEIPCES